MNSKMGKRARNQVRQSSAEHDCMQARKLVEQGKYDRARRIYEQLTDRAAVAQVRSLAKNNIAVLAAIEGDIRGATGVLRTALTMHPECEPARLNLALLEADLSIERSVLSVGQSATDTTVDSAAVRVEKHKLGGVSRATPVESLHYSEAHRSQRSHEQLPKCLLVVVTYNRLEYTKLALDAVLALDYPALEMVIWDNASTDGTTQYLKQRLARVRDVRLELSATNVGVVQPTNAVWGSAHDAELLMKIDNDTLVPPNVIKRLAECHIASDRFGVLSGFHFRSEGEAIAPKKDTLTIDGVQVLRQQYVGGCSVMIRRQVYERFGPVPCQGSTRGSGFGASESRRAGVQGSAKEGTQFAQLESGPFLESGWTTYQRWLNDAGLINGYPWPPIHVDHMEDTRSPHCIRTPEHETYKHAMRGMSLDEFTRQLCVWRPH